MTWKEKYRRDPDIAESIIETLQNDLDEAEVRVKKLEYALERIRDYHGNWALSMRQIAREALE
jgi:endonuclease V-like protein UPF0215 family